MNILKEFTIKLYLPLLISLVSLSINAQEVTTISGRVTSTDGKAIENAIIELRDKNMSLLTNTTSSKDGKFYISLLPKSAMILVKCDGYKNRIVKLKNNKAGYNIILNSLEQNLDEVVVTGYVNKQKDSYVGASYIINRETFDKQINRNLLDIIRQNTPGFELTPNIYNGADPNKLPDMVLRGHSSFIENDKTNLPLFILDGTEVNITTVFNLLPSTVERISVLKDAAATAYYGSKAANGVIVITSRPTKSGNLHIDYEGRYQISTADLSSYNLLNAAEKLEFERSAGLYGQFLGNSKIDIERQKLYYTKLERVKAGINTEWLNFPLRTAFSHNHNIFITGGAKKFRYNISTGYQIVKGIMDKSNKKNLSLLINITYGNWSKLFVQFISHIDNSNSSDVPYGSFSDYALLNPYDQAYNIDGSLNKELSFGKANPLYEKKLNSYIRNKNLSISNSIKLRCNIIDGLRFESSINYTIYKRDNENFYSPLSQRFAYIEKLKRGEFNVIHSNTNDLSANLFFIYAKPIGHYGNHFINITIGGNIQSTTQNEDGFTAIGILSDKIDHVSLASGFAEGSHPVGDYSLSRQLGSFLNLQYIYLNRYFIDTSIRYEGSSKFGTDNKYAPFSMIGLGWNLHKEKNLLPKFITILKLRTSIGNVGNVSFNPYQAQLSYRYSPNLIYNKEIGAVPVALVNPRLKWEKAIKRNIGIDFELWHERLSGSIEYYHNTTKDLVMTIAKPPHVGFSEGKENIGQILNTGYEISLRSLIVKKHSFILKGYIIASHNSNKIIKISDYLKNQNKRNINSGQRLPVPIYSEGESLTALKVMKSAGINPANGKEIFIKRNGEYTYEYDYNERQTVGDLTPNLQGSGGITATFKNFTLSMAFTYRLGATIYNATLASKVEGTDPTVNADKRVFYNRWKTPGQEALFKNIAITEVTPPTSRFIGKEYCIEGSSLMLSYDLANKTCNKIHIKALRLSFSVGNYFYLSTIKRERGLNYPFARNCELRLNIQI